MVKINVIQSSIRVEIVQTLFLVVDGHVAWSNSLIDIVTNSDV